MPNKLTLHWTVGHYTQTFNDYHFCICYDAKKDVAYISKGIYKPEDNDNTGDGRYAPHCYMGNTGNIGIGICAMFGYRSPKDVGDCPITAKQLELAYELEAECAIKYGFKVTPETVFTHHEHDAKLPKPEGKIDIICIPTHPELKPDQCGDFIREKVLWYYEEKMKKGGKLRLI